MSGKNREEIGMLLFEEWDENFEFRPKYLPLAYDEVMIYDHH